MNKAICYVWGLFALLSALFYAFTGRAVWVDLEPQRAGDLMRLILLAVFHVGGPLAVLHVRIPE